MTSAESKVIRWAFNLAESTVAGDYKLPCPMNIALNSLQDAVWELAKEHGMKSLKEGCSQDFLECEKKHWAEAEEKLKSLSGQKA